VYLVKHGEFRSCDKVGVTPFDPPQQRRRQVPTGGGTNGGKGAQASAGARAYNGGLVVEPPAGARGRAPLLGSEGRSP